MTYTDESPLSPFDAARALRAYGLPARHAARRSWTLGALAEFIAEETE